RAHRERSAQYSRGSRKISSCVTVHATQAIGIASSRSQTTWRSHWVPGGGAMGLDRCKNEALAGPTLQDASPAISKALRTKSGEKKRPALRSWDMQSETEITSPALLA